MIRAFGRRIVQRPASTNAHKFTTVLCPSVEDRASQFAVARIVAVGSEIITGNYSHLVFKRVDATVGVHKFTRNESRLGVRNESNYSQRNCNHRALRSPNGSYYANVSQCTVLHDRLVFPRAIVACRLRGSNRSRPPGGHGNISLKRFRTPRTPVRHAESWVGQAVPDAIIRRALMVVSSGGA